MAMASLLAVETPFCVIARHVPFLSDPLHSLSLSRSLLYHSTPRQSSSPFFCPSKCLSHTTPFRKPFPQVSVSSTGVTGLTLTREELVRENDPTNNVPDSIFSKIGLQLHRRDDHPIGILKNEIYKYFDERFPGLYHKFDNLSPIVSVKANFDDVLVPPDHVSRSYNDTYYINAETVLRCHTSAHQAQMLRDGYTHFLVTGDVYRRDSIDATHNPVFHQMEGFRVFSPLEWEAAGVDCTTLALNDLKDTLEGLAKRLFGDVETRWIDTYFPFTNPSLELEIFFQIRRAMVGDVAQDDQSSDICQQPC